MRLISFSASRIGGCRIAGIDRQQVDVALAAAIESFDERLAIGGLDDDQVGILREVIIGEIDEHLLSVASYRLH